METSTSGAGSAPGSTSAAMNTPAGGSPGAGAAGAGNNGAQVSAGATTSAGAPNAGGSDPGAWMAGFSDDLKGKVSLKGFRGPADLADAYFAFEKLRGAPQERQMLLPEQFTGDDGKLTPEGRAIYERLGAPKDSKGYELEKLLPKEGGDKNLMQYFESVFHEAGVPKDAATAIVSKWNEFQANAMNAMKEKSAAQFRDQDQGLRKEWGAAFEQNLNIAKEGVRRLGVDSKTVDAMAQAMGHQKTMNLFKMLGSAVGESAFVTGKATSNILEPATAKAKIAALRQDKSFADKLLSGDTQATKQWTDLHAQAHPGENLF